jgi:branched-chain amino acid transport system substrate-binding protein
MLGTENQRGRTRFVALRLAALATLVALCAVLVACGDDDKTSSTSGGSSTATADVSSATGKQVQEILGTPTGDAALEGQTIKLGAVLPLSGSGSYYGKVDTNGIKLAAAHVKAAGGPTFDVSYLDNKSGDPQAGIAATREMGIDKTPISLASFSADLGAQLPGLAQYKIFTLDGGGGAPAGLQGKPYFYGARAVLPTDDFGGTYEYLKRHQPDAKTASFVTWDIGEAGNKGYQQAFDATSKQYGITPLGMTTTKIGATDFSSTIAKLKSQNPDIILLGIYGLDPANFMKQYVTSGMKAQVVGFEITPDAVKLAGDAYKDFLAAGDSFTSQAADNEWGNFFAKEYKAAYGIEPDFYAANYYEDVFALWTLAQRVKAAGGDVNDGEQYVKALEADPKFQSLYGKGDGKTGSMTFDTKTHTLSERALTMYSFADGTPKPIATFNIGGADYQDVQ